ncbi:peptidoglycan-binding protein [Stappia sp. MMSF_3263]|uniref:peptidoglycan-binding protein n=1 Tax=Stappia sp. MMSF_3263 TaxID=3046693 RepID=UPI00273E9EFF|nr:peptidoglycan-binding protein [Stappia sp. MMSF_3263]
MSWNARHRTQGGTDPEAGYGRDPAGDAESWYEPRRRAPAWSGERAAPLPADPRGSQTRAPERARAREQLNDVADALGRLMDAPAAGAVPRQAMTQAPAQAEPNRHARRAAAARARSDRPAQPVDARTSRIEAVLGALDRLDRRVEDLSQVPDASRGARRARPAMEARAYEPEEQDVVRHDYDGYSQAGDSYAGGYDVPEAYEAYADDYAPSHRPLREDPRPATRPALRSDDDLRPLIHDLAQRVERAHGTRDERLDVMRREIGELRAVLMESLRAERTRPVGRDTGEMRRLSEAVERLRADRSDNRFVHEVRAEISDLRAMIGQSNVDGMLQSLESGYAHLVQRLDEMARDRLEPRLVSELGQRLSDIEDAFRIVPRADQLVALDDRVADIGHRVEELVRRNGGEDMALLRGEIRAVRDLVERIDVNDLLAGIDERLSSLSVRFDAIDRLIEGQRELAGRVGAIEHRLPQAGAVDRLNDRLEQIAGMLADDRAERRDPQIDEKLGEIAGRLKRIENARQMPPSYDAAFTLLEKRLAAIDGKINALDRPEGVTLMAEGQQGTIEADLIARLENGISRLNERFEAGRGTTETGDLDALHREIAGLRESVSRPVVTAELEAQLRDLAEAVNRGASSEDNAVLAQVEDKIAALASKLDAAETGFARLGEIQSALQSGASNDGSDVAQALRGDLHRLMEAATSSERRARDSMDSVQDVLASINSRLMSLEQEARAAGMPMPSLEDDRPLEPGSGKPRVRQAAHASQQQLHGNARADDTAPQAPARPASARPAAAPQRPAQPQGHNPAASRAGGQPQDGRDRKADFIAAARRAAQAAAEEAGQQKSPLGFMGTAQVEEKAASAKGWLRSRLGRKRKDEQADVADVTLDTPVDMPLAGDRRDGPRADSARKRAEAATAELRADTRPVAEGGDELAEAGEKGGRRLFSTGGRRAVMLAAAAVVIAVGALQIFKQVSPSQTDMASLQTPPAVETSVGGGAPVAADMNGTRASTGASSDVARSAGGAREHQPQSMSEAPAAMASAGHAPGEGQGTGPVTSGDPAAMAPAGISPTGDAAAEPGPDVAFGPQTPFDGGFSSNPAGIPGSQFQAPSDTAASTPTSAPGFDLPQQGVSSTAEASLAPDMSIGGIPQAAGPIALRQAAATGDPAAYFAIAVNYTEGVGSTPDLAEAAKYYAKAAEAGLAPAQYRLGSLFEKGRGVEKNLETARDWYRRAAEQGNAKASHNLAVLYAEGFSGSPEFPDAAYWFKKAANFGLADSQYNLGILYARGLGLEKNMVESYKWFALAARQGDRDAGNKRDELANMLSKEELAEARIAVETWKEAPRLVSANEVELSPAWTVQPETAPRANVSVEPQEIVMSVQRLLAKRGFDPGTPDGQVGPRTREAVRAFQEANGLPVTGAISKDLVKVLIGQSI